MNNVLKYKNYIGSVEYDDRDGILHGKILGISDVISYEANSIDALKQDFRDAVDDYLDNCKEMGKEPEKPFSGKFLLRMPRDLHAKIAAVAQEQGKSLNSLVNDILSNAVHEIKGTSWQEPDAH